MYFVSFRSAGDAAGILMLNCMYVSLFLGLLGHSFGISLYRIITLISFNNMYIMKLCYYASPPRRNSACSDAFTGLIAGLLLLHDDTFYGCSQTVALIPLSLLFRPLSL